MGLNISVNSSKRDKRYKGQIEVEKMLGMQIIVPQKVIDNEYLLPQIDILSMGIFDNGEFQQISNLNVINVQKTNEADKIKNMLETFSLGGKMEYKHNEFALKVTNGWTRTDISRLELSEILLDKTTFVDRDVFGIKKYVYVVSQVYKGSEFTIIITDNKKQKIIDFKSKDGSEHVFGYVLDKYRIDKHGHFKCDKTHHYAPF